jgi:hypothetical protein
MRVHLPRRRVWRVAIYLGSLVLILLAIDVIVVQARRTIHPGYSTTRILEPKLPDGRVDYIVAIDARFSRGVTAENNAAPLLLQALGPEALSPKQPKGVMDYFGMQALPEKGDYFIDFETFAKKTGAAMEADISDEVKDHAAWPIQIGAGRRAWIAANARPLALIEEASRRERFFIPLYAGFHPDTLIECYLKHLLPLRRACHALLTRAVLRLEAGDAAGFREDVLTVHRWARLLSQAQTLIERSVAVDLDRSASETDLLAAHSGKMPATDLRKLCEELGRLGELDSPLDAIDSGERYMVLDLLQWMAQGGPNRVAFALEQIFNSFAFKGNASLGTRIGTQFLPVAYDQCMTRMNAFYDGLLAAARQPTWKARHNAIALWEADVNALAQRNRVAVFLSSDWPMVLLLPSITNFVTKSESATAYSRLARVALALAAYRVEHGRYPDALSDLSPQDIANVPDDPFADAYFKYAPAGDGYKLYSIGPDMLDNGGAGDDLDASIASAAPVKTPASTAP